MYIQKCISTAHKHIIQHGIQLKKTKRQAKKITQNRGAYNPTHRPLYRRVRHAFRRRQKQIPYRFSYYAVGMNHSTAHTHTHKNTQTQRHMHIRHHRLQRWHAFHRTACTRTAHTLALVYNTTRSTTNERRLSSHRAHCPCVYGSAETLNSCRSLLQHSHSTAKRLTHHTFHCGSLSQSYRMSCVNTSAQCVFFSIVGKNTILTHL